MRSTNVTGTPWSAAQSAAASDRDAHPHLGHRRPDDRDRRRTAGPQPIEQLVHRCAVIAGHDRGGLGHSGGHQLRDHDGPTGLEDRARELVTIDHVGHHESVDVKTSRLGGRKVCGDERHRQLSVLRALHDADGEVHVVLHEVHAARQPETDRTCPRPSKVAGTAVGRVTEASCRLEHAGSRLRGNPSAAGQRAGRSAARDPGEIGDVLECRRTRRWHVYPLRAILWRGSERKRLEPILHNRLRIGHSMRHTVLQRPAGVSRRSTTRLKDVP